VNCVIELQDNGRCFLFVHCYFYILYGPCKFSISQMYVFLDYVCNFLTLRTANVYVFRPQTFTTVFTLQFCSLLHFRRPIAFGPAFSTPYTLVPRLSVLRFPPRILDGAKFSVLAFSVAPCSIVSFQMTLSDLAKYSMTQNVARSLCNS